jgi:hypothetical protein
MIPPTAAGPGRRRPAAPRAARPGSQSWPAVLPIGRNTRWPPSGPAGCLVWWSARGARWCPTPGPRGQPGPAGQLRGGVEAGEVAGLGGEHRGQHRSGPGHRLDGPVPVVPGQLDGHPLADHVDLEVEQVGDPPQRPDPGRVGGVQPEPVQQLAAADAEQVAHRDRHALFGQHRMHLRLQPGPQGDELGPVPHLLPHLAHRSWAVQASGSRPIRSRSARSAASRASFFTRR